LVKQGPGRRIVRSRTFSRLNVARNRALSASAVRRDPDRFHGVRTFCFFVGHNKSGTSMVGALLDAHPNVVLADEVDALQYVQAGFRRDQIFHLLLKGSRTEARKGRVTARRLEPYSYWVPGQWQGRYSTPLVVGDSTSGTSTRRLGANSDLLDRLPRVMSGVDVKVVQVIRNPFDPISVMMVRGRRSMENSIGHYFAACETLVGLGRALGPESLLPVRHEAFVAEPEAELARVCRFVGVEPDPQYLRACASIIRRRPDRSRDMVAWTGPWIDLVDERIARFDFLRGYSYGN
jgi:hypothetical protein